MNLFSFTHWVQCDNFWQFITQREELQNFKYSFSQCHSCFAFLDRVNSQMMVGLALYQYCMFMVASHVFKERTKNMDLLGS